MPTPEEIQTCINNLTTNSDSVYFPLLAIQARCSDSGIAFHVATVNDLPDIYTQCIGDGQIMFVDSIGVPVVSTCVGWQGLDGRLLRYDLPFLELYAWGSNFCGALGDNQVINQSSPVREITSSINWCQISVGRNTTKAIKTDGSLWAWGTNVCGDIGDNTVTTKSSPVREITSSTNWCQVSSSDGSHTIAIKNDSSLWAWGINTCGGLGDNTITSRSSPVREITSSTNWCQVSGGIGNTGAIKNDGSLWAWGRNTCGKLGDNTETNRSSPVKEITSSTNWCQVSAGGCHTSAIKIDGSLWSWGSNLCGRLGDNTTIPKSSPVREITSSTNWCQVSASEFHTSAIKTDGSLWAWGCNASGRLGNNSTINRSSPVREITSSTNWCQVVAGNYNTSAIKTDGSLWAWGSGSCGILGDNTTIPKSSPVREITSSTNWCQVSAGYRHMGAIKLVT
jgi:hypothetical protein